MTGSLSSYPQGRFPEDMPPTLLSPAKPKKAASKPSKHLSEKEADTASMMSTSTFSSTVSLLKSKLPTSYKDHKARKEAKEAAAKSSTTMDGAPVKKSWRSRSPLPPDTKTPRQRTAEAYMIYAATR